MILYVDTPKLTAKAPKNQWLEDDIYFLLGPGLVSGVMLVSGRVAKSWLNLRLVVFPMIQKVLYTAGLVEVWTVISNNKDKHLYNVAIGSDQHFPIKNTWRSIWFLKITHHCDGEKCVLIC